MTRFISIALVLLAGCKIRNELSCDIPGNCADAGGDAPMACEDNTDCTGANAMFCLVEDNICVECLDSSTCAGTTPVCSATNQCEACTAHSQCDSAACDFASGACLASDAIAYVEAGAVGTECTQTAPCGSLALALATAHPTIKVKATQEPLSSDVEVAITRDVTILADVGATLARTSTGAIITATGNIDVELQDLVIANGLGVAGDGIRVADLEVSLVLDRVSLIGNNGHGLLAGNGGRVTVRRSVVSGNVRGGIVLSGARFDISNTLIVINGSGASETGGFRTAGTLVNSSFHFNTVANNVAGAAATTAGQAGVACGLTGFAANSNIISNNQAETTCTFVNSMFDAGAPANNFNGAPDFLETNAMNAREPNYFRIGPNSMAIDAANPATNEIDVDGDHRPQGDAPDVGADERTP